MSVSRMLRRVTEALDALPSVALVGTGSPTAANELPAIALSALDIETQLVGIGARPAPSRRGALEINEVIDLANPVAVFADGSEVDLVSDDRLTFFLPFGPAVTSDGVELITLGAGDVQVELDGVAQTVVPADPDPGDVRANAQLGTLEFGTALPNVGTLDVTWFLGEWEVTVHRFQGTLGVDVYAASLAEVDTLSEQIEQLLLPETQGGIEGLLSVAPSLFGPTGPAQAEAGNGRLRRLEFAVDAEIEDPLLSGGGGLIGRIDVDSAFGAETFSVPVETEA